MRLFLLTALTMTAFAANSVLNRMGVGPGHIGAVEFAVVRLLAGAGMLALLLLARARGGRGRLSTGAPGRRLVGAGSLLLYLFGFSMAYGALDAGVGALILFGTVQITMFAGALALREEVPARRWVGAGLAFAGLLWLFAPGEGAALSPSHAAMMAAAGLGWGIYSLSARGAADPLGATAWNFLFAGVPGVLLAVALVARGIEADAAGLSLAILSGAVTSGLGYALWYAILPALGAARAAVAQLSAPVIAAFGGLVLIGEPVTPRLVVAALMVLGGVAFASLPKRR
ncbi:DMT family transporter [Albidovulum sediminicola]|uniref:DMT family transporter n=1 Tax=Albidovulum sediminicola TaxID=2984331 RepID=A0ABT2Z6N5_9RHOB|nr:DMT family transporter [Defluviimonas sp. WL0075]MCV2866431.1 DMT family transporter [Defluviimonas sp. WL0075]